ncbi:MAG: T9SS type A sorting domain-containing protein, partial [Flavobacteriales bacterium]|nr:T9SS type A sorting domain-containing protein [Flavobacteriales bacterium]
GINEIDNNTSFSVYPNPSKGDFNINLNSQKAEMLTLTVNNIVGQTVMTKQVRVAGQTNETISLAAGFDKGVYFLTIDNNKEKQTVKLIVE